MNRQQSVKLGDILYSSIPRGSVLGKGLLGARINSAYRQAVGSATASATLSTSFKDGCLKCRISSSVLRMNLTAGKDEILKTMNSILGSEEVKSIIFI